MGVLGNSAHVGLPNGSGSGAMSDPALAAWTVPAPGNKIDKLKKWCLHCSITSTLQWRTGPLGESTLCNGHLVPEYWLRASPTFNQSEHSYNCLVPEYRSRASPTFNQSEHSYKHREVLKIRKKQEHLALPAAFKLISTRKHRMGKGQQQPTQVRKKRKGNKPTKDHRQRAAGTDAILLPSIIVPVAVSTIPIPATTTAPSFRFLTNCWIIHYNGSYCSSCMVCINGLCGICWKTGLPRVGRMFDWPSLPKQH
ncbi:hypothetical protein BDA96_02G019000 [Sorghum bicolor]|uniref:GATA-type domain-containing protein n=1 Tax=Sorghum bicolor TaxID=4558 RepID=A0A921URD0_SORBI|nr:hypothetical protein BDA96_02G019000 [Sorghum bicolor]